MGWSIEYFNDNVKEKIYALPNKLAARYVYLTKLMLAYGAHLGMPHTRNMGDGLLELRLKSQEGIARVFYCTIVDKRIVMLHAFTKKSQKTPAKELKIARQRLKELKS